MLKAKNSFVLPALGLKDKSKSIIHEIRFLKKSIKFAKLSQTDKLFP
jgi:hypothetical protein